MKTSYMLRGGGFCMGLLMAMFLSRPAAQPTSVAPGGFLEASNALAIRTPLTAAQIAAFVPTTRGRFTFPAPYGTEAWRVTLPADCPNTTDCVEPSGYAYWKRLNAHVGQPNLLILVGLARAKGGVGPSLFALDKTTGAVSSLGPLFAAADGWSYQSAEQYYFSATAPTMLYVEYGGTQLARVDALTKVKSTVFDLASAAGVAAVGANRITWQAHSSNDDTVHSFTVRDGTSYAMLGCGVYQETTKRYQYFPKVVATAEYDECQIDASGRWLDIKEDVDGKNSVDNRFIDLTTGAETRLLNGVGGGGHSDNGYGTTVMADNFWPSPAFRLWTFGVTPPGPGTVVYVGASWASGVPNHISVQNATSGPVTSQYMCGSGAERGSHPGQGHEVSCTLLDGSLRTLVVAPTMVDLDAPGGGDDYSKYPKGNLDVTGQYFFWTANLGGPRLDAFIVHVPSAKLAPVDPCIADPLTVTSVQWPASGSVSFTPNHSVKSALYQATPGTLTVTDTRGCIVTVRQ